MSLLKNTLGDIVRDDFRTAALFTQHDIDFCCGGKETLESVVQRMNLDENTIVNQIEVLKEEPIPFSHDFKSWEPIFLMDYIVQVHHAFVRKNLPSLLLYTHKIAEVHGENHPELKEVATLFSAIAQEMTAHLQREEEVVFPAIRSLFSEGGSPEADFWQNELDAMHEEHEWVGANTDHLKVLTNKYALPSDACPTYQTTMNLLQSFEEDLHIHVHLENNILFPKVEARLKKLSV